MRLLLLGKSGMLGSCFLKHLAGIEDFEMFAFDRSTLDICDFAKLEKTILEIKPDFVINCTAYTDVDGAEANRELAMKINGEACEVVAKACNKANSTLVHFSTDYVFDGKKAAGYDEDDNTNPISTYGESKLAGEKSIQANMEKYYIVRTSWLFGENGKNFVGTMLRLSETKVELDIVDDQIGSPTFTADLCRGVIADFLGPYMHNLGKSHHRCFDLDLAYAPVVPEFGIFHLTNAESCSWYDFAAEIFKLAKKDMRLNRIASNQLSRPAKRPSCSILINNKLPSLRPWQAALEAYLPLVLSKV